MKLIERFLSRKLIVFIVATALLCFGKITENIWIIVACAYLGINILEHLYVKN